MREIKKKGDVIFSNPDETKDGVILKHFNSDLVFYLIDSDCQKNIKRYMLFSDTNFF